jgi:DNA-binding transcriptional ArsR family regulator
LSEKKAARVDRELEKALSHPLRARILEELRNRAASPRELAVVTGESVGTMSYHVKTLAKCGCLELVDSKPQRGTVEHFFRARPRSTANKG